MSRGKKVSIIGTGNVGATVCYWLSMRKKCREIVMIDRHGVVAHGKALDILQATSQREAIPKSTIQQIMQ